MPAPGLYEVLVEVVAESLNDPRHRRKPWRAKAHRRERRFSLATQRVRGEDPALVLDSDRIVLGL